MNKKNKLLTIGQFAALHGINKKTLMWYDEIGLFKPAAINLENGYRCYNYHQSPILETILLLRELDVSVPEIQNFMKNRFAQNLKCLLNEKIAELDLQLLHLQAVRKTPILPPSGHGYPSDYGLIGDLYRRKRRAMSGNSRYRQRCYI